MNTAMIYRGDAPHPAHRGFADTIGADLLALDRISLGSQRFHQSILEESLNGALLPSYDVYIAEGTRALYGSLTKRILGKATLIYLASDQSLYELQYRHPDEQPHVNGIISRYGMSVLQKLFDQYIDGVMAVSEFTAEYTSNILDKPARITQPYIQPQTYNCVGDISPDLDDNTAVTIGSYSWYKGQDIFPEVWSRVREEYPRAELYLIGAGYPPQLGDLPGITVCGFVENISEVLSKSSIYVHPARAEAFGVSVVEALRAGIPAVVTATTGAKSAVYNATEEMVVPRSAEALSDAIISYFDRPFDERRELSQAVRQEGLRFDSESRKSAFRDEFNTLIKQVSPYSLS